GEHVEVTGVVERRVVDPVDAAFVMVGIEPLRPICERQIEPHYVTRDRRRYVVGEPPCLYTCTVARRTVAVRDEAVPEGPRPLNGANARGVDEIEPIVAVVPGAAATEHVAHIVGVAAEA